MDNEITTKETVSNGQSSAIDDNVIITSAQATLSEGTTNKYATTVFKSAYWHGQHMLNFFMNYDTPNGPKAFSFIIKRGKFMFIYNLTESEKISFAKAVVRQLSQEELQAAIKE